MTRKTNAARKAVEAPTVEVLATPVEARISASDAARAKFPSLEALQEKHKTKSAVIRALAAEFNHNEANNLCSPIARHLGVRYQHVRNVLTQPLKRVVQQVATTK